MPATASPRRAALVTGGGRGIGRAVAVALAASGMDVAVSARSADQVDAAAAEIGGAGIVADLAVPDQADALAERARDALGRPIDVFVHAAGITYTAPIAEMDPDRWEQVIAVNVGSAFRIARQATPAMTANGWGRIVTICSLYSRIGVAQTAAYCPSKHALLGLTRVLAAELVHGGVTANAVVPGWTDTEMVRSEAAATAAAHGVAERDVLRRFLRDQPLGRLLAPSEVAGLVDYLCSDAAAGVTGQALHIDGGSYQA